MPSEEHLRLTASGTIFSSPGDIFSYGFALRRTGPQPPNTVPNSTEMTAIVAAVKTFHTFSGTRINGNAVLTKVKVAAIDSSGHYTVPPVESLVTGGAGSSSGTVHPSQVSIVVSLRGTVAVRPARGRFYLPIPGVTLDSTGRISTTDRDGILASVSTLYDSLQTAGFDMAIASSGVYGTDDVREIRVGRVLDTQRRRRNDLLEDYAVTTKVPT